MASVQLAELIEEVRLLRKQLQVFCNPLLTQTKKEFRSLQKRKHFEAMLQQTGGQQLTATEICRQYRGIDSKTRLRFLQEFERDGLIEVSETGKGPSRLRLYRWIGPTSQTIFSEMEKQAET